LSGLTIALILEYLKRLIARWHSHRTVSQQLGDELMNNLRQVESSKRMLEDVVDTDEIEQQIKMGLLKVRLQHLTDDRYQHYLSTQKEAVYKVDKYQMLKMFYRTVTDMLPKMAERHGCREMIDLLGVAAQGGSYARHGEKTEIRLASVIAG
jgi:hypothetical protein